MARNSNAMATALIKHRRSIFLHDPTNISPMMNPIQCHNNYPSHAPWRWQCATLSLTERAEGNEYSEDNVIRTLSEAWVEARRRSDGHICCFCIGSLLNNDAN